MKLGKIIDGIVTLVECENGQEVGGTRTEEQLYNEGFKKACLTPRGSETDTEQWNEYPTCIVQTWIPEPTEEPFEEE